MPHVRTAFSSLTTIARTLPRQFLETNYTSSSMSASTSTAPSSNNNTISSSTPESQPGEGTSSTPSNNPLSLPEPPTASKVTNLDVSGDGTTAKLDHLGPIVVNQDGSLSRIGNWDEMSNIEQKNAMRILGKRNAARLAALRSEGEGEVV